METYADKLAIFGLLDQLSDAAALGDVKAVKFLRDSLISCFHRRRQRSVIQVAVDRALAAIERHQAAA